MESFPDPTLSNSYTKNEIFSKAKRRLLDATAVLIRIEQITPIVYETIKLPTGDHQEPRYDCVQIDRIFQSLHG